MVNIRCTVLVHSIRCGTGIMSHARDSRGGVAKRLSEKKSNQCVQNKEFM